MIRMKVLAFLCLMIQEIYSFQTEGQSELNHKKKIHVKVHNKTE